MNKQKPQSRRKLNKQKQKTNIKKFEKDFSEILKWFYNFVGGL